MQIQKVASDQRPPPSGEPSPELAHILRAHADAYMQNHPVSSSTTKGHP